MAEYEQEHVLCEDCGEKDACCTVAVMMGSQVMHRRLCQECMAKASMSIAAGNIGKVLGALMAAAHKAAEETAQPAAQEAAREEAVEHPAPPEEEQACPRCGTLLSAFRKNGRLGCSDCYSVFREQLLSVLSQRCPQLQHTGRRPLNSEEARRSRARREELQRRMEEAVARDDFEAAAALRDELRDLSGGEVDG